jgi:hypothetical protein
MIKFNLLNKQPHQETYNEIIHLTPDDLGFSAKNKDPHEIGLYDFKPSSLSLKQMLNAKIIVFNIRYSLFILKNIYGQNNFIPVKNVKLTRDDLLPQFSSVSLINMEIEHFKVSSIKVIYCDNIIYEDEFNGYSERKILKY